jgi:hypothetical protein
MALTAEQEAARLAAMARGAEPKPQPRILESNITPELCAAIAEFQASLPEIVKDRRVEVETKGDKDNYSYDYATLENVNYNVIPKLGALGLAFISLPTISAEGKQVLRYYLTHSSGGFIAAEFPIRGETYQAIGSAITYIRRYAVQGATGVAAPEEDDGGMAADADTGPRVAARRARTDQAAANTARANTAARRQRPPAEQPANAPTSPAAGRPASTGRDFGPPRDPNAPISNPQGQKLAILFGELGWGARDVRLVKLAGLIGREVTTMKALTMGEAHEAIETIEAAMATGDAQRVLEDAITDRASSTPADRQADAESVAWERELNEARENGQPE